MGGRDGKDSHVTDLQVSMSSDNKSENEKYSTWSTQDNIHYI